MYMKKSASKKLDLNQLKVESFITSVENPKAVETGVVTVMGCKGNTVGVVTILCAKTRIGC